MMRVAMPHKSHNSTKRAEVYCDENTRLSGPRDRSYPPAEKRKKKVSKTHGPITEDCHSLRDLQKPLTMRDGLIERYLRPKNRTHTCRKFNTRSFVV